MTDTKIGDVKQLAIGGLLSIHAEDQVLADLKRDVRQGPSPDSTMNRDGNWSVSIDDFCEGSDTRRALERFETSESYALIEFSAIWYPQVEERTRRKEKTDEHRINVLW